MPAEWDAEKLIDAVQQATPPTNKAETDAVEGLLLAVCTKIKNGTSVPAKYTKIYHDNWAYVQMELWRNT
jgi:hypothetical protein